MMPSMEQTDSINPWIDPAETRRLAERLKLPSRMPVIAPDGTGFDDKFVGYSNDGVPSAPAEKPEDPAPEPACQPEDDGETGDETTDTGSQHGGVIDEEPDPEVEALFEQLRERFGILGFFVVDADGQLKYSAGGYDRFQFIASGLAKSGAPSYLRTRVASSAVVEALRIETEAGALRVCLVGPEPLSQDAIAEIRRIWQQE